MNSEDFLLPRLDAGRGCQLVFYVNYFIYTFLPLIM